MIDTTTYRRRTMVRFCHQSCIVTCRHKLGTDGGGMAGTGVKSYLLEEKTGEGVRKKKRFGRIWGAPDVLHT